jgi:adenine-specific DNA methylase
MQGGRRLIETEFPIKTVSEESVREKNSHSGAEISTLHIYWARRPMSASRTTTFAALLPDDAQRRTEWLELVEQLAKREVVAHKSAEHRQLLQTADAPCGAWERDPPALPR